MVKQTVQLAVAGNFTYRDVLLMESRERQMHYEALVEIKKEEREHQEKAYKNSQSRYRIPSMPSMPRFRR